jgi:hypothetical protein
MASGAKKKTTMAKLNRERNVRERRFEKQARKDARKAAAAAGSAGETDALSDAAVEPGQPVPPAS